MLKKLINLLLLNVLPFLAQLLVRFIYFTSKKTYPTLPLLEQKSVIFAGWHGELIITPLHCKYKLRPKKDLYLLISQHKDGEYIAKTFSYFNLKSIRGSSTRGGMKALLNAIKTIEVGNDIAITPDGPRGPRHTVHDGVVAIAKKTNSPIVAVSMEADRFWQFDSWDKFVLPKPFSNIVIHTSEPFYVTDMDVEEAKKLIHDKICRVC